nr:outer membrane protein assembly factor BamD [candidate division Zixibacteria bacterium]
MNKSIHIITGLVLLAFIIGCSPRVVRMAATPEEQLDLARAEFNKKHWLTAVEGFQKVIFNFPGSMVVDTAQYLLGMSYFENEDYELAAVEFRRLMSNYPQSDYVDEAQYMEAVSYLRNSPKHYALDQEDLKKAIQMLRDFIMDNPDSPLAENARASILEGEEILARKSYENGMTYFKMYDYRAASIYFQEVIDNYTGTSYAPPALFKLGESQYRNGKYPEALQKFNSFITIYPTHELISRAEEYVAKINRTLETVNAAGESR